MRANRFQFSLLGLLLVITFFGLVLGTIALIGRLTGMGASQAMFAVLQRSFFHIPLFLIWSVGGVLIWQRRRRHPQVSRYALLGICGLAAVALLNALFSTWLQGTLMRQPSFMASSQGMVYYFAYIVIISLATSGCWILILVAILGWRGDPIETPAISGTPGMPGDPESDDGPS